MTFIQFYIRNKCTTLNLLLIETRLVRCNATNANGRRAVIATVLCFRNARTEATTAANACKSYTQRGGFACAFPSSVMFFPYIQIRIVCGRKFNHLSNCDQRPLKQANKSDSLTVFSYICLFLYPNYHY